MYVLQMSCYVVLKCFFFFAILVFQTFQVSSISQLQSSHFLVSWPWVKTYGFISVINLIKLYTLFILKSFSLQFWHTFMKL